MCGSRGGTASAGPPGPEDSDPGAPPIPDGASLSVNVALSPSQKAGAHGLSLLGGPVVLDAAAGAFVDLSGNPSEAEPAIPISVLPDLVFRPR